MTDSLFPSLGDVVAGLVWLGIGIGLARIARDDWRAMRRERVLEDVPPPELPPAFRIIRRPYDHANTEL